MWKVPNSELSLECWWVEPTGFGTEMWKESLLVPQSVYRMESGKGAMTDSQKGLSWV